MWYPGEERSMQRGKQVQRAWRRIGLGMSKKQRDQCGWSRVNTGSVEEVEVPEEMGSQIILGSLVNVRTWAFTLGGHGKH